MTISISEVVNVQLSKVPTSEGQRDFGMLALLSEEFKAKVIDGSKFLLVSSQEEVELRFGTSSETAKATRPFMSASPRPARMLISGIDRTAQVAAPATKATLESATTISLPEVQAVGVAGKLALVVNGNLVEVFPINLAAADTIDKVVTELNTKLAATCAVTKAATGTGLVLTAVAAGVGSIEVISASPGELAGPFSDQFSDAFLKTTNLVDASTALKLRLTSGAVKTDGKAAVIAGSPKQTESDAIKALSAVYADWYAVAFTNNIATSDAIVNAGKYVQALDKKVMMLTTQVANHIEFMDANPFKQLYDATCDRTCAFYHTSDKYLHMSAAATMLAVKFEGSKTVKTMKFKQAPGVASDNFDLTVVNKAKKLGINVYTYFGSTPMLTEGTTIGKYRYFDEIHWLDWLVDAVQKNVFNALISNPNQYALTDLDVAKLLARVKEVARTGVRNGGAAPGVWRIDGFGSLQRGDFLEDGYYAWADSVANLTDTEVDQRSAPTMYLAIKRAGAVHRSDIIIGFSR